MKLPLESPTLCKRLAGAARHPVSAVSMRALAEGICDRFDYEVACQEYAQGTRAQLPVADLQQNPLTT